MLTNIIHGQEIFHRVRDFCGMCFQCEMSGVIKVHCSRGDIAFERFRPGREKERIVLAPDGQQRWLVFSEIFLKLWVERNVSRVIPEEIELHFVSVGTSQIKIVQRTAIWGNHAWVRDTMRILECRRFWFKENA